MVAPVVAAAGAAVRAGAMAAGRGAAVAGRATGSAAKAGAQATGRGLRSAAKGASRSAKGLARGGGQTAGGASRRVGSGAKDLAASKARGPGSASRTGWNYRNPSPPTQASAPTGPKGIDGAQVKRFLSNRLKRMLLLRAWRKSRKDRKNPRSPLGKARAKARRMRRRVRRVVVLAFMLTLLLPVMLAGFTAAQLNDAMAASNGGEDHQEEPVAGDGDPRGSTEPYRPDDIPAVTQRLLDAVIPEFGRARGIGCTRNDPGSDHNSGHACDFMVSVGRARGAEEQHGHDLAAWAIANAEALDIQYVIWQNEIWNIDRPNDGWRPQNKVGSWSYTHYDHVHISLQGAPTYR